MDFLEVKKTKTNLEYFVLIALTIVSCVFFEFIKMNQTLRKLLNSYKQQFILMADKSLDDRERQMLLIKLIKEQLIGLGKLILSILLLVAPFFSLFLLRNLNASLDPAILLTWWGLVIPMVTVFLYLQVKKIYVKVFRNR